jgi:hypothetical protein
MDADFKIENENIIVLNMDIEQIIIPKFVRIIPKSCFEQCKKS